MEQRLIEYVRRTMKKAQPAAPEVFGHPNPDYVAGLARLRATHDEATAALEKMWKEALDKP